MSGQTIEILEPSLAEADALAKKLSALPEVSRTMTLSSFVPEDQDAKLALIAEAAGTLDPALNPKEVKPAPTDAETVESLEATSAALHAVAAKAPDSAGGKAAGRLSKALASLAKATPGGARESRNRAHRASQDHPERHSRKPAPREDYALRACRPALLPAGYLPMAAHACPSCRGAM